MKPLAISLEWGPKIANELLDHDLRQTSTMVSRFLPCHCQGPRPVARSSIGRFSTEQYLQPPLARYDPEFHIGIDRRWVAYQPGTLDGREKKQKVWASLASDVRLNHGAAQRPLFSSGPISWQYIEKEFDSGLIGSFCIGQESHSNWPVRGVYLMYAKERVGCLCWGSGPYICTSERGVEQ